MAADYNESMKNYPACKEFDIHHNKESGGLVVECLTQDQGVVGLSLTGGTMLCP